MQTATSTRQIKASEGGYTLIAVVILLAIFVIAAAVAIPKVAESIQRDRDVETMHRGKQYIRAIQLYYRKFHAYPPNMEALVKSNEIRFLRKKYVDPITGKDDWKPIMYCQNKTPMAMGFFGQPLAGTGCGALAGVGPGGGNGIGGGGSLMPTSGGAAGGVGLFSSGGSGGAAGQVGVGGTAGTTGSDAGASGGATDANGTPLGGSTGAGPTFGGAGIVGVEPASAKQSILIYKKKNHYNEWEFLYSPMSDQQMMVGGNAGGVGQPGAPGMNQNGGAAGGLFGGGGGIGGGAEMPGGNNGSTPIQPPATVPIQPPDPPSTTPQQ